MTQVEAKHSEDEQIPKSNLYWLLAGVLVVLGAGVLFLNRGSTDVAAADVERIESLMADWNAHDGEAVASHFTVDGVLDATVHGPFLEPFEGRDEIADRADGYSVSQVWEESFGYAHVGEEIIFNARFVDTDFGSIERPRGVSVVMSEGLIQSLVFETDFVYYCLGDTPGPCKDRETGSITPAGD